jgi:hypothetical protein
MFLQANTLGGGEAICVPESGVIVRYRFPMGADRGRLSGGNRCKAQNALSIARAVRVMCKPRRRDIRSRCQGRQYFCVQTLLVCLRE